MEIRQMTIQDLDQVLAIEKDSFQSPWSKESMENELNNNPLASYLVLVEGGEVLAYGGMWMIVDEGHITNIAVKPSARGKGYGEFLLFALLSHGKEIGLKGITLEVRKNNTVARALYRKHGFKVEGERKKYYEDGQDALICWKYL